MTIAASGKPSGLSNDPLGAVWRRWEPHIHTPGTALSDAYGAATLDMFLSAVEAATPLVEVLGVTDYCLTRRYEEVVAAKSAGRIPHVALVFCNVELRLSIETKAGSGVNLHLLVCPDDADHVDQLKRFLARLDFRYAGDTYTCSDADLVRLGRAHDPTLADDEAALRAGVNQFKVDFNALRKVYDEAEWARANILVAVAGSSNDGTAGLQDETASFAATRKEIERFAHIVFTATPKNVAFWRGQGVLPLEDLERRYGGAKPCLHGSDAHSLDKIARPDQDRRCWVKGDPTFDSLRQACIEPALRVHLGPDAPPAGTPFSVCSIVTPGLPWLIPQALPVNAGMVAVIGARGSGKTALADLIAHAGSSPFPSRGDESFLSRARPLLNKSEVSATWTGNESTTASLDAPPSGLPDVNYLTQQFVDRLCSSVSQNDELLDEIKRVVFQAHDPADRLGADDFDSLVLARSTDTQLAVAALEQRLDRLSADIATERDWFQRKAGIERDLLKVKGELSTAVAARNTLTKPGGKERADYYGRLTTAVAERELEVQEAKRLLQALRNFASEVTRYSNEVFPNLVADLQRVHSKVQLTETQWQQFLPTFTGDPAAVVAEKIAVQVKALGEIERRQEVTPTMKATRDELHQVSLTDLKAEQIRLGALIGADQRNGQRLKQVNDLCTTYETRQRRLQEDLARANASADRLAAVLHERSQLYSRFFELIIAESETLQELYLPLQALLADAGSSASKLSLRVVRDVDVEAWARAGEELLDLRKNGQFRGRGALAAVAREALLPAWRDGSAADVVAAMEAFRRAYDRQLLEQAVADRSSEDFQAWIVNLGRWLYSTGHITVQYVIEYEGVPISQLSPGTRGIVLLLLYLALDLEDSRPLIIDQPEENLYPQSVFAELVALFRQARTRRQVIIVTHNANLVVNTDVDQVIVASCVKQGGGAPPEFRYQSGGLENPAIRRQVCNILEGGEAAFRQRAKRLRVELS